MLLIAKIIGGLCTVAIPTGIYGVQVLLTKTQQENQKKAIDTEVAGIKAALSDAHKKYDIEIKRIQSEKNTLAETKKELTYVPVIIQSEIGKLKTSKQEYETQHAATQAAITKLIEAHKKLVEKAKTDVETLWTNEKSRVEAIQTQLENAITTAKNTNSTLQSNIDTLKSNIDTTINGVFNP